jgi:hypothetical protein
VPSRSPATIDPLWSNTLAGKGGARSMGRYPFLNAVNQYLEAMNGLLAETTWKEYKRRLERMDKDFCELVEKGVIKTSNPWKMTDREILAYLKMLKARGMAPSGISHNIDSLTSVFRFIGNSAMDRAKIQYAQNFLKRVFHRQEPIGDEDRCKIIESANKASESDWQLMLGYGITIIGICSGLEPRSCDWRKSLILTLKKE